MSTIRPQFPYPAQPQPQPGGANAGRNAAQQAFFALAGQARPTAAAAEPPATQVQAVTAPATGAQLPPEAPQKILRPGSLIDIRV